MRLLLLLLCIFGVAVSKAYFSYDHLVSWPRPTNLVLSPDSNQGIYFTTTYSLGTKNVTVQAFVTNFAHSDDDRLPKTYNATHLFAKLPNKLAAPLTLVWLDATTLAFLQSSKLWTLTVPKDSFDLDKASAVKSEVPALLSELKGLEDVADLKYDSNSQSLLFSAKVAIRKGRSDFGDSGRLYDQLFVRHWDTWTDTDSRRQLFYVKLNKDSKVDGNTGLKWSFQKDPINLLANTELETPVAPFGDTSDFAVSPDGKEVAFVAKYPDRTQAWSTKKDVYIVSVDRGLPKSVTSNNEGACSSPTYSPNGKHLAWLQMSTPQYESDKNKIMLLDLENKNCTEVAKWWDRSPSSLIWSGQSDKLFVTADDIGRSKLFYINLETNKVIRVTKYDSVSNLQFLKEDIYVATLSSFYAPPEFYTIEVDNYFKVNRQSNINSERSQDYLLSSHEDFFFKGSDGHDVHGMLLKPPNFRSWRRYPLAFLIHGGPQGMFKNAWSYGWNPNIYTNAGYVVVMINPHGSTGYGQKFTDEINKDWGGKPYKDLMLGLDYVLEEYPFIDKRRIAGLGGSYGGYMVNWINGHTNRFRVLVNHDGIFDTVSSYFTTDELYFIEHDLGGLPWQQPETYRKWSPASYLWKWSTPTLVIHSRKDYRLVEGEGLATFTALQRQGIKSRLLFFDDENHWVLKHANQRRWYKEVLEWINLYCSPSNFVTDLLILNQTGCMEDKGSNNFTLAINCTGFNINKANPPLNGKFGCEFCSKLVIPSKMDTKTYSNKNRNQVTLTYKKKDDGKTNTKHFKKKILKVDN